MYNRYEDQSKFIMDMEQLCIAEDGYVYISKEEDYGIAIDMESCYGTLDEVKSFIIFLQSIFVNWTISFNASTRKNDPSPQEKAFPFELEIIYIEEPDCIVFDYWCTVKNTQLDVTFEYKENHFFLRKHGAFDCIPDNWEETE